MNTPHSPVAAGRSTPLTDMTIARSARLAQTRDAREAEARELEVVFAATKTKLRTLTATYAREVREALAAYHQAWVTYAQTHGVSSDYDEATNSKFRPRFLGEALGRMLATSGLNVASASMSRGARQVRRRRG